MFLEQNDLVELGQGPNRLRGKWPNPLTMQELGLPEPTSEFWIGRDSLSLPSNFKIYDASGDDAISREIYQEYNDKTGMSINVKFHDGSYSYPMNQYIDLYNDTYNSNDKRYVLDKVYWVMKSYITNLYEVQQWKDKTNVIKYVQNGILMFDNLFDWVQLHTLIWID